MINSKIPYKKGSLTLSLGGEKLGACFLQNEDFYTGQNIAVLQNDNISNWLKTLLYLSKLFLKNKQNNLIITTKSIVKILIKPP